AAFDALLSRYSGQEDIVVGSPIASRTRAEVEGLIGFFVNTLALRVKVEGGMSFRGLVRRVKDVTLEGYTHQDVPFEKLVEELEPERSLRYSPLFQVMMVMQNAPKQSLDAKGLKMSEVGGGEGVSKFDLTLAVDDLDGHLVVGVAYNVDLFEASTIERLLRSFAHLLAGVVADPQQQLAKLPLLDEAEQRQLLVEWNETQTEFPSDKCVHELFEEHAAHTPDAVAVVYE